METRKDSLGALKLCRFCLSDDKSLKTLYDRNRTPNSAVSLSLKILSCLSLEVFPSDKMPSYICSRCQFFMELSYEFKQICRKADENILQFIQEGTELESVEWPKSLHKLFNFGTKSETETMKTVLEGGATIQVSTNDASESDEEDDENVFNVKIEEGSEDGSRSTHVKLITNPEKTKERSAQGGKESEDVDYVEKATISDGCWPCEECDCTYPLLQLLELHKLQKHRDRTFSCHLCPDKFFTKNDLMVHQLRHSSDMPFQCVACDKQFKRLVLLKRHEKFMHSDLPQLACPNCPATFLSLEELKDHQKKHNIHKRREYDCKVCGKMFHDIFVLQRHTYMIHNKNPAYACKYCPQRFCSISKLTRHVRAHAGDRAYPCKFCDKSFVKSHHYTRHLRMKHHRVTNTRGQAFRCEQCDDAFCTQDELIYHSAVHATQSLRCPLCQERFDNVDAVTAHIKSHVNGVEFMCDYCELVFISKDKLDYHLTTVHEEELNSAQEIEQDESSMEMEVEDEDEDNDLNVKVDGDNMVVEIKKTDNYLLVESQDISEEANYSMNSEESEAEATPAPAPRPDPPNVQALNIIRKAEEVKRKVQHTPEVKEKIALKVETANSVGGNDKSLRLLEKELQDLKRTNTRNEPAKTLAKPIEMTRNRRTQIHTSTPKMRSGEEKRLQVTTKTPVPEKKLPERRMAVTKENKEPPSKEDKKDSKEIVKETSDIPPITEEKEDKDISKNSIKNGNNDKADDAVRRSTRPSKVKDYAKMIRDKNQDSEGEAGSNDDDDEEYREEISPEIKESRPKLRRSGVKVQPKSTASPSPSGVPSPATNCSNTSASTAPTPRKRGRPRKEHGPAKMKKEDTDQNDSKIPTVRRNNTTTPVKMYLNTEQENDNSDTSKPAFSEHKSNLLISPSGHTLKKVPIKALPPGVKPLPLPVNARPVTSGEVCEMQIGKKVVKVQKIVMTKAEVEAMAKQGLVEMKGGTMVLKQGIKIPTSDPTALRSSLMDVALEAAKESPVKKDKPQPMRCDIGDDS